MALFGKKNEAEAKLKVNYDGKEAEKGLKSIKGLIKTVVTIAAIKMVASYTKELAQIGRAHV